MPTFIRIHENIVQSYIQPGGEVYDLVWDVAKNSQRFARAHVNDRTGRLSKSITANRPKVDGIYQNSSLVWTNLKYATWVHEGTPTIFPVHGTHLAVPNARGIAKGSELKKLHLSGGPKLYHTRKSVSGQDANPFLLYGLREALTLL